MAVFGNARRFLKNLAAIGAFQGQDLIDSTLRNIGITLAAETGVHKQLVDVAQTHALAIDIVFAFARAVIPPGNHQLVRIEFERTVGIVQDQRRLRETHGTALLRAAENDVLHLLSTQRTGVLLAHDPANSVGNIRFSAAVRADDRGNIVAEGNGRLIRKGLKALNLKLLQIHLYNTPIVLSIYPTTIYVKMQARPPFLY